MYTVAQDWGVGADQLVISVTFAYGLFNQAIVRLKLALTVQDLARQNADTNSARDMMFKP